MGRTPQPQGHKGSLKWIQRLINECPELLNVEILGKFGIRKSLDIKWLSPVASDEYSEYRGQAFLDLLDVSTENMELHEFWPRRGPQWDALGKLEGGSVLLVEAKSHIAEILTDISATDPKSISKIQNSLELARQGVNASGNRDWTSPYYQYANRMAHLYFLRGLNLVPAYLVFVYFLNDDDVGGPGTKEEWHGALKLVHSYLGLGRHMLQTYVAEVFIDVRDICAGGGNQQ